MTTPVKTPNVSPPAKEQVASTSANQQSKFDVVRLSTRRLLKRGAISNLTNLIARLHPADIARVIMNLDASQERRTIFELVKGVAEQGKVVSELSDEMILELLEDRKPADLAWMLRTVPADDAAYILGVLPDDLTQKILPLMKAEESQEVASLMSYPKGTAGSIMTTEFFSLPEETIAREAIQRLQQATKAETVFYIYATDGEGRLTGVVSLRELLVVAPTTPLRSMLRRDVISVSVETAQKEVASQVANYNLLAIPVVDAEQRLVGIITVDDVVDVIRDEDTKDMLKMAGAAEEDAQMRIPSFLAAGLRFPWLFTNLAGSLVSGFILWWFRFTIQEVVAVVTFIPVIAAMGGNLGLQSSTLIIRGLATGRVEPSDIWKSRISGITHRLAPGDHLWRALVSHGMGVAGERVFGVGGERSLADHVSYFVEYCDGDPLAPAQVSHRSGRGGRTVYHDGHGHHGGQHLSGVCHDHAGVSEMTWPWTNEEAARSSAESDDLRVRVLLWRL